MSIIIDKISKKYEELTVLEDFSMSLDHRKIHCFFGPSGSGKTTLLNIIAKLVQPDSGSIQGRDNKNIAYVFQEDRLLPWCTVKENIEFVLNSKEDHVHRIEEVLSLVNLKPFEHHYPHELSGGMKQRLSLARAFAFAGEILVLDEPFKGLHLDLKHDLMDAVTAYSEKAHPYIIFVTHDMDEALYISDEIHIFHGPPLQLKQRYRIELTREQRKEAPHLMDEYKKELQNIIFQKS